MKTCKELLSEYRSKKIGGLNPSNLCFEGVDGYDVYNITAPFTINGERYIAGRVEKRDTEHSSINIFKSIGTKWVKQTTPEFTLQDPFISFIGNEIVLGGVEISPSPEDPTKLNWCTVLLKGENLETLKPFFKGPNGMKDIRLKELENGIAVFTRPQGEKGGRGKIGFVKINSLDELSVKLLEDAPILENMFADDNWGGANEIHVLGDGTLGILGHVAEFTGEDRHYYSASFIFDYKKFEFTNLKIIAERKDFVPGDTKRPDLSDVIFSGGLNFSEDKRRCTLFCGISDCEAQSIEIPNPFLS